MVVRRTTYPQVDPRAAGLMTQAIVVVPRTLSVAEAARLGRRRQARLLVARVGFGWGAATPDTLEHALRLGLDRIPCAAILWGTPVVAPGTAEVEVRRRLEPATPFVLVARRDEPIGAVLRDLGSGSPLPLAVRDALARLPERIGGTLRRAGRLGDERGFTVVAVGGFVRDLLLRGGPPDRADLDLAVEGDARVLARGLADALGGVVREHAAFLTATVELDTGGRIDVATARRERYVAPGALPEVEPASVLTDLARRDFSVNALGIRLDAASWGQILDPTGGLADLRGRRIRVLHPLSFVEDPTRIFRALRFALRLGCRLEARTRRLLSAAAALPIYGALSGDRLRGEIEAILAEPAPADVLTRLGRLGVFRLLLATYRFAAGTAATLRAVAARTTPLPLAPTTREALYVLALTKHLRPRAATAWVGRLGLSAPTRAAIERAPAEAARLLVALRGTRDPGEAYATLRRTPELVAAWAHVGAGPAAARRRIVEHLTGWRYVRPLLNGEDLKALGLVPGPCLGRGLEELLAAQVAGRVRSREDAVAWARDTIGRLGRRPPGARRPNRTRPGGKGG